MRKIILAGAAVALLAGSGAVYAQHRWDGEGGGFRHHVRLGAEDRLALVDARIAAVKAGLKLTPDQEKSWPAVESAVRDFAKERIANANAMGPGTDADTDPVTRLRSRADRMASTAAGLKRIADAAEPLYKTLDDGQKRRLAILTRMEGPMRHHGHFGRMGDMGPGMGPGPRDDDGPGFGRGHGPGMGPGMMQRDGSGRL
jgi:hypothetical protein